MPVFTLSCGGVLPTSRPTVYCCAGVRCHVSDADYLHGLLCCVCVRVCYIGVYCTGQDLVGKSITTQLCFCYNCKRAFVSCTPPRNKKCGSDPSGHVKIRATKTPQNSHWGVTIFFFKNLVKCKNRVCKNKGG